MIVPENTQGPFILEYMQYHTSGHKESHETLKEAVDNAWGMIEWNYAYPCSISTEANGVLWDREKQQIYEFGRENGIEVRD
jgi:hypothetical protein